MSSETAPVLLADLAAGAAPLRPKLPSYVLITPARNEAALIGRTIECMLAQSVKPVKWVIVSDGSTDGTDEVVERCAASHTWVELVRMPQREERHFAAKVHAFNAGYSRVRNLQYEVIGNLDADITFDDDYFGFLMKRFAENPRLGVAGTPFREESRPLDYRFVSSEHVSGGCQLFRRECFEEIGGYTPIKTGGVDLVAVYTSRMKGWQTRRYPEKAFFHNGRQRPEVLAGAFKGGAADYLLGCDPLWQFLRCTYRLASMRPLVLNGALCWAGYAWAALKRAQKPVSPQFVEFRRREERRRLRDFARRAIARLR